MSNLPFEILQIIFLHLHQQDKVECMTVCRIWKRAIEESALLHNVYLYDKQQFNNFMSKCQQESELSRKIGRLIIDIEDIDSAEIDLLPFMILNVRELYFYKNTGNDLQFAKTLSPHPWSKTIKKINEKSSDMLTTHILKGGICPALTELKVCGANARLGRQFIRLLENASALNSLSLTYCDLSLEDLELLHKITPLLSSFSIEFVDIDSTALPIEIQPATRVTSLTLDSINPQTSQAHINLHNYLAIKYPKIVTLEYSAFAFDFDFDNLEQVFASQIEPISPLLTSLNLPYAINFQLFLPTLEQYNCTLKKIGLHLIGEADEINIFVQSKQAQHIQSLSLLYMSSNKGVNYLRDLPALTELNLDCLFNTVPEGKITININTLLESVGSNLVKLRISQAKVVFDPSFSRQYDSLKYLELQNATASKQLDHFISRSFPRLRTLIIDSIIEAESTFYLGNLNLSSLQLKIKLPPKNPYVLVMTTTTNKVRWYTSKPVSKHRRTIKADHTAFPAVRSFPTEQSNSLPCVNFMCNSIYDFFLVNLADPQ